MFAADNRAFVARQHDEPGYAAAARGADQLLADLGVSYRSLPYYFRIGAATHAALARATHVLVRAQDKLLRHLVATHSAGQLTAMFEVPPDMASLIDWADLASAGLRMLRADIIPTEAGYYFCELNHFSGVGAGESYHSAHAFAELLNRPVAGVSPFRQLAHLYVTQCRPAGLTRVVVLDTPQHRAQGFGEHVMLKRYLRLMAPDLETSYHDEHTYPPHWLRPDEAKRTLVHRLVTHDDTPDGGAFLALLRDRGATVSCMFEAELKMHRRWFSLLCDPGYQHLLDAEELATIEQYVPHTYDLHPGNLDAAVADKDRLVFKRSYTYGGKGVLIGEEHPPGPLHALLTADGSAWVAQRRVPTSSLDLRAADGGTATFRFVLGMFLYGEHASGLLVRASARSHVVNVSQGGGASWAFVE
ncbi:MAG: hypothetical protein ABSB76_11740 [Streptosporangiaceae bacterium]|jgi:hypothetical protein